MAIYGDANDFYRAAIAFYRTAIETYVPIKPAYGEETTNSLAAIDFDREAKRIYGAETTTCGAANVCYGATMPDNTSAMRDDTIANGEAGDAMLNLKVFYVIFLNWGKRAASLRQSDSDRTCHRAVV